jgi:hypothetical protein
MKLRQRARALKRRLGGMVRVELRLPLDLFETIARRGDPEGFIKRAMRWGVAHRWRPTHESEAPVIYTTQNTMTASGHGAD